MTVSKRCLLWLLSFMIFCNLRGALLWITTYLCPINFTLTIFFAFDNHFMMLVHMESKFKIAYFHLESIWILIRVCAHFLAGKTIQISNAQQWLDVESSALNNYLLQCVKYKLSRECIPPWDQMLCETLQAIGRDLRDLEKYRRVAY